MICPDDEIEMVEEKNVVHSPTPNHNHFVCPKCKLDFCVLLNSWWGYRPKSFSWWGYLPKSFEFKQEPVKEKDFREEAEKHWKYTEGLVQKLVWTDVVLDKKVLEIFEYLYVEAMVHGFGHGREYERNQK